MGGCVRTLVRKDSVSAALQVMPPSTGLTHFHSLSGVRICKLVVLLISTRSVIPWASCHLRRDILREEQCQGTCHAHGKYAAVAFAFVISLPKSVQGLASVQALVHAWTHLYDPWTTGPQSSCLPPQIVGDTPSGLDVKNASSTPHLRRP